MEKTDDEIVVLAEEIIFKIKNTLAGFIIATMPDYQMGWVHKEICFELDKFLNDVVNKKSPRLMLTMPPRSGKSEIASRRFPAYILGRFPNTSIICASYSADLSSRMNRDVQRIIDSEEYKAVFPYTKLSSGHKAGGEARTADLFEIVGYKGIYRSAGVGGGITGMGADIIIIDDPVKDRASADSETIRQSVYDWYTSTLYTRLSPGGGIILIQTRWNQDDLAGRLLEAQNCNTGDKWHVVNFPAIAECDERYRKQGEALHPERYPLSQLLAIKQAIGSRDWEALYQQHPVPDGGAIFKEEWFKFYSVPPSQFDDIIQSWDMSFKDSDTSDFVVGQLWGKKGADYFLLDQVRGRWSFTDSVNKVMELSDRKNYNIKFVRKLIEDKANGTAIIDTLKHKLQGIIPITPDGSKTARANAITAYFEAGNIYLPDKTIFPWINEYITELLQFPAGVHDDQVDATSQALRYFDKKQSIKVSNRIKKELLTRRPFSFM